jgi:hypothetical protein
VGREAFVPPVSGRAAPIGSARSPWQKGPRQNIPAQPPSPQLRLPVTGVGSRSSVPPPVTQASSRTSKSPELPWATAVSDALGRRSLVRGPKAVNKLVPKGEKRARSHTHPQISISLSPSLPLAVAVARARPSRRPVAAQLSSDASRTAQARASLPPQLRLRPAGRVTVRCGPLFFFLRRLLRGRRFVVPAACAARSRFRLWIFLGFFFCGRGDSFCLIRASGGACRSDWRGVAAMQRQGRHLERSNSKRALDHGGGGGGDDDDDRAPKRPRVPALAR